MPHEQLNKTFHNDGTKFDIANALWLARLSREAYRQDERDVARQTKSWGLKLVKWHWQMQGATEAALWITPRQIFVVFRGTNNLADWRDNASIGQLPHAWGKVHGGFFRALERIEGELLTDIAMCHASEKRKIWIAGHSLGGALALLMAAKLRLANLPVEGVYTYGKPRVGNRTFVRHYNAELRDKTYRVVNYMDLVPRLSIGVYKHSGHLVFLDDQGGYRIGGSNQPDRVPGAKTRRSSSKASPRISRRKAASLKDHKIDLYIQKLEAIRRNES